MKLLSGADDLDWDAYHAPGWALDFPQGARLLDVGCGAGRQVEQLAAMGHRVRGVESDPDLVEANRRRCLDVVQGKAERLGEPDASYDGVVCKVVISYTLEDQAVAEIARVLRPGGRCYPVSHGAGYYLRYLLKHGVEVPALWRPCPGEHLVVGPHLQAPAGLPWRYPVSIHTATPAVPFRVRASG